MVTARVLSNVEAADGVVSHLSDNSVARSGQAEHQGILCATQEGIESAVHGEGTGNGAQGRWARQRLVPRCFVCPSFRSFPCFSSFAHQVDKRLITQPPPVGTSDTDPLSACPSNHAACLHSRSHSSSSHSHICPHGPAWRPTEPTCDIESTRPRCSRRRPWRQETHQH